LHSAALSNKEKTLTLLLDKGANINAKSNDGKIPLYFTKKDGMKKSVRVLQGRIRQPH
jgi:ankyrin repeat protein